MLIWISCGSEGSYDDFYLAMMIFLFFNVIATRDARERGHGEGIASPALSKGGNEGRGAFS